MVFKQCLKYLDVYTINILSYNGISMIYEYVTEHDDLSYSFETCRLLSCAVYVELWWVVSMVSLSTSGS